VRIKDVNDETQSNAVEMKFYDLRSTPLQCYVYTFWKAPLISAHTLYLPFALLDLVESTLAILLRLGHIWEDFRSIYVEALKYKAE
jgi:hypothetical protein